MARITVVNDYPEFLELMRDLLEPKGHVVSAFDGDTTTFEEVVDSAPQLLIIDLLIEGRGMTGWDFVALSRADERLREVPVIVCSGFVEEVSTRTRALEAIAEIRVLTKPFAADDLFAVLDDVLGSKPRPSG